MRIIQTLAAMLVITAIGGPVADARPTDQRAYLTASSATSQDLRSPDARDAALAAGGASAPGVGRPSPIHVPHPPTEPAHPPSIPTPAQVTPSHDRSGIDWTPIALTAAAGLLAIAAASGIRVHRRGRAIT